MAKTSANMRAELLAGWGFPPSVDHSTLLVEPYVA